MRRPALLSLVCAPCAGFLLASLGCTVPSLWQPTSEEVIDRILPSSVQIVLEENGKRFRTGSGVAIASRTTSEGTDCFVLTSGHTFSRLSGKEKVYVLFDRSRGVGTKVPAALLAQRDTDDMDLALLRTHAAACAPAVLGTAPSLGNPIWVVAFPWGRNMTLVSGTVSQINSDQPGDQDAAPRLMVDASVSYGASGGGVYDKRTGRLVGVIEGYRTARVAFKNDASSNQYIDVPVPGETYVVPLSDIRRFLIQTDHADLLRSPVLRATAES